MIAPPNLEPISQLLKVDVAEYQELVYCSVSSAVLLWTADIKAGRESANHAGFPKIHTLIWSSNPRSVDRECHTL